MTLSAGWTVTDKSGKVAAHTSATELTLLCSRLDEPTFFSMFKDDQWTAMTETCDDWAQLQPNTQIEKVTFPFLITRLLRVAPPSSDFNRYRGLELKTTADLTVYDATLLPNDIAYEPACTIEKQNRGHTDGMLYIYRCMIETSSFPEAVALKSRLIQSLKKLSLDEDQVREHGLSVNARQESMCAPTGECLEGDVFASVTKDYKFLQIDANPDLTRSALAEAQAMQYGHDTPISGISQNSGSVLFEVYSVGPLKN
ncbi:MAG: hypothetical protein M3Y50_16455 [Acidobacteriota bacterium]|nr:hypothetical protein [Acidobacteriota bacterium]